MIYNFAISDLKIRYRNSILGFFWTFLEPLLILATLYIIFTNLFNSKIEHFPLYILVGIIMWNMFARGTQTGLGSILTRSSILTQIYLPREIPSLSSALTALFMFCFEMMAFAVFLIAFQFIPPITALLLPFVVCLEFILIVGISLPLSVLNVRYRDIQFIWTVVLQLGFFLTPIFYKSDILPSKIQDILYFSPMVRIIDMTHDLVLYNTIPSSESILTCLAIVLAIFGTGYIVFKKLEPKIIEEL
ncbi:putative ABC transporter, permease protein [Nitrosotalea sinensis]|uniref:Putative ABC transporter, permease protein n=1 Tax=Nitrosotalea sinensis TaxID=1499975 RepID=A0A2H1EFK1_9ARCH|nr:ABC transporter permease [Candidatus Nitrosotalea sinensis]SHO42846.1 putative ABC transporter, permease protein [Candidatus Nitrosotalea sinensis]